MNKPTLLYVEEVRNSLSERTVSRRDINLVILRFKQSMNFEESYIQKTASIPCFILDKNHSIESEAKRFKRFCNKQNIVIDYFYNDSEYNQELIQEFASLLKLSGSLNKDQALCVRDKAIMKNKLQEIGYRTMPYKKLNSIFEYYANSFNRIRTSLKFFKKETFSSTRRTT